MSAVLQQAVIDLVRGAFTKAEVATVAPYAGEFSADESVQVSFTAPAIFVAVLGWKPWPDSKRLTGRNVRGVRMAAFVVTKHAKRDVRMQAAMNLAERLALLLQAWVPEATETMDLACLEVDATVENLYSRAMDAKGMALWLVDWMQAAKPTVAPAQLFDLLAVDITDNTQQGQVPDAPPAPNDLTVTEAVNFNPLESP